jgi:hypothetical protein
MLIPFGDEKHEAPHYASFWDLFVTEVSFWETKILSPRDLLQTNGM